MKPQKTMRAKEENNT